MSRKFNVGDRVRVSCPGSKHHGSETAVEEIAEADIPQRRRHIEEVFRTRYNVGVDFDIHDCLSRLERDGVVTRPADGMLRFPSYAQAAAHYDQKWRESDEVDIGHVCDPPPPDEVQEA
jgi:hypothetical protein